MVYTGGSFPNEPLAGTADIFPPCCPVTQESTLTGRLGPREEILYTRAAYWGYQNLSYSSSRLSSAVANICSNMCGVFRSHKTK